MSEIVGIASSSRVDRRREKISERALAAVAAQGAVPLVVAHQRAPRPVGWIERWAVQEGRLYAYGRLEEDTPEGRRLTERLRQGERLALSLGGRVREARWGWDAEVEGPVRILEEIVVDHVAVCTPAEAINPETRLALAETAGVE